MASLYPWLSRWSAYWQQSTNNMLAMPVRIAFIALALIATACGSSADDEVADTTPSTQPAVEESTVPSDAATTVEAEAEANDTEANDTEPNDIEGDTTTTTTKPPNTTSEPPQEVVFEPLRVDCSGLEQVPVGLQTGAIVSGGVEYKYQWTVPSTYDGSPIPVVLDFHAIGSNGAQQAVFAGWTALAETAGFLAVEPTGIAVAPDERASWELPPFDTDERNDVAMVRDLLDQVASNVCIDPARIYATGMSNGALFTSVLVCDLGDFIAAAVSVAGVTHDDSCNPSRPVPYLAFHGTDDTTIPYRGEGETTLGGSEGGAFFEQVMPEEFGEFAADFGCTESTDSVVSESVTLTAYTGCTSEVEMGFYTIDGGGHTWPGSVFSSLIPTLGVTTMEVDATALAWEFFQRHSL